MGAHSHLQVGSGAVHVSASVGILLFCSSGADVALFAVSTLLLYSRCSFLLSAPAAAFPLLAAMADWLNLLAVGTFPKH